MIQCNRGCRWNTEKTFKNIGVKVRCENFMCSFAFQLDSYEIQMKFHVLSFATEVVDIVDILDSEISGDTESVIWHLMDFDYNSRALLVTTP